MAMKKVWCVVLVVGMLLSLSACGNKLKGTYKSDEALGSYMLYTFEGNRVTIRAFALTVKVLELQGTYEISADGEEITFSYADGEDTGEAPTGTLSFEKGDGYIGIGGAKLYLQE